MSAEGSSDYEDAVDGLRRAARRYLAPLEFVQAIALVEAHALERAAGEIGDDRKAPRAWLRERAAGIRDV